MWYQMTTLCCKETLALSLKLVFHQVLNITAKKIIQFQFNRHFPHFALLPGTCYIPLLVWFPLYFSWWIISTKRNLENTYNISLFKFDENQNHGMYQKAIRQTYLMAQILNIVKVYVLRRTKQNQFNLVLDVIWK